MGRAMSPALRTEGTAEERLAFALAEKEALYRMLVDQRRFDHAVLDGVDVGIATTSDDGRVTFLNRHARELLGVHESASYHVRDLLGLDREPHEILGEDPRAAICYPLVTVDGVELDLDLSITHGERSDGIEDARVGFFFIFRDVRAEKQQEAERSRFERLAAMGTMVAGFAHEVRNPVAALRSIAEELIEELSAANLSLPHARRMLDILERIERLVRTWLRFGRPAAPKRLTHRPWSICSSALSGTAERAIAAHDQIRVEVEPDLPDVYVDAGQIMQALVILLDNALDAAGAPSRVLLRARVASVPFRPAEPDGRRKSLPPSSAGETTEIAGVASAVPITVPPFVLFEVIDEGPGIPLDILNRIFDPFFTTKPSGTGLGLAIAQQIVSENGGRLEVSAPRDAPTTFTILLPVPP